MPITPSASRFGGKACGLQRLDTCLAEASRAYVPYHIDIPTGFHEALLLEKLPMANDASLQDIAESKTRTTAEAAALMRDLLNDTHVQDFLFEKLSASLPQPLFHAFKDQRVAIRSSAMIEDQADDAAAGRYDSIVENDGVDGNDIKAIFRAILTVIAGAYSEKALAHGILPNAPENKMGVVVQHLVKPVYAGVIFSVTPGARNDIDTVTLTFSKGLLISGQNTPATIVMNARHPGSNTYTPGFGKTPDDMVDPEALGFELENQLLSLAKTLEARWNCPVDIEFAIDENGKIAVIQCRPIVLSAAISYTQQADLPSLAPTDQRTVLSQGVAQGALFYCEDFTQKSAYSIPNGAVVVTAYFNDALETALLRCDISAVVLGFAGPLDHGTLVLQSLQKPAIQAGPKLFETLRKQHGQIITLAAGTFNGEEHPRAVLHAGQHADQYRQTAVSSSALACLSDEPNEAFLALNQFQAPTALNPPNRETLALHVNIMIALNTHLLQCLDSQNNSCIAAIANLSALNLAMMPDAKWQKFIEKLKQTLEALLTRLLFFTLYLNCLCSQQSPTPEPHPSLMSLSKLQDTTVAALRVLSNDNTPFSLRVTTLALLKTLVFSNQGNTVHGIIIQVHAGLYEYLPIAAKMIPEESCASRATYTPHQPQPVALDNPLHLQSQSFEHVLKRETEHLPRNLQYFAGMGLHLAHLNESLDARRLALLTFGAQRYNNTRPRTHFIDLSKAGLPKAQHGFVEDLLGVLGTLYCSATLITTDHAILVSVKLGLHQLEFSLRWDKVDNVEIHVRYTEGSGVYHKALRLLFFVNLLNKLMPIDNPEANAGVFGIAYCVKGVELENTRHPRYAGRLLKNIACAFLGSANLDQLLDAVIPPSKVNPLSFQAVLHAFVQGQQPSGMPDIDRAIITQFADIVMILIETQMNDNYFPIALADLLFSIIEELDRIRQAYKPVDKTISYFTGWDKQSVSLSTHDQAEAFLNTIYLNQTNLNTGYLAALLPEKKNHINHPLKFHLDDYGIKNCGFFYNKSTASALLAHLSYTLAPYKEITLQYNFDTLTKTQPPITVLVLTLLAYLTDKAKETPKTKLHEKFEATLDKLLTEKVLKSAEFSACVVQLNEREREILTPWVIGKLLPNWVETPLTTLFSGVPEGAYAETRYKTGTPEREARLR
jgi:hypothetical protein